ncbi:MAG TPA: PA14 domain-containing protein [Candidatus Sulfomarinibacteraceae bacterium]|nr:PA14 domain-containing protein [Candidatus Sulfomarinibacteraceae bacterium]
MNSRYTLALLVLAFVLLAAGGGLALAQDGSSRAVWQAAYWNNVQLSGEPVLTRTETALDHNWGLDAPAEGVSRDRFSARWTTTLDLPAGRYRFTATMDDGMRVWVDELLIINSWRVQSPRTTEAEIELEGGPVPVRVEYFDNAERAVAQLSWEPVRVGGSWYGEFFDNAALSGSPVLVRNDPFINFNWGQDSPAPDVLGPDRFSARWRRTLDLERGLYRFQVTVDDGARLWVNDELLIDAWRPQPVTTVEEEVFLEGGAVPVRLEYFENAGLAQIALNWTRIAQQPTPSPTQTPTPPPTAVPTPAPTSPPVIPPPVPDPEVVVVIDDQSPGFEYGGRPIDDWHEESGGIGGSFLWTWNSERLPTNYNWGQWRPNQTPSDALLPGQYEVAAYIPPAVEGSNQARYWVAHDNGFTLRIVDQAANRGRWVSLGTFFFDGADDYVSLADITLEEEESTRVVYDAVRWTLVTQEDIGEPALAVDADAVSPGQEVNVLGTGFPPGEIVQLVAGPPNADPRGFFGQRRVGPSGEVLITFTMPDTWSNGDPIGPSLSASNQLVFMLMADDGARAFRSVLYQEAVESD